jgi:hypothetical protein
MSQSKKAWAEPKLIVLVRSEPEEAVLALCKGENMPTGSNHFHNDCRYYNDCSSQCSELGPS